MTKPDRSVAFLVELVLDRIKRDEAREKEWRTVSVKESRRFRKNVNDYMRFLEQLEEICDGYDYKHGIGK